MPRASARENASGFRPPVPTTAFVPSPSNFLTNVYDRVSASSSLSLSLPAPPFPSTSISFLPHPLALVEPATHAASASSLVSSRLDSPALAISKRTKKKKDKRAGSI